jgi:hypothetical protein
MFAYYCKFLWNTIAFWKTVDDGERLDLLNLDEHLLGEATDIMNADEIHNNAGVK